MGPKESPKIAIAPSTPSVARKSPHRSVEWLARTAVSDWVADAVFEFFAVARALEPADAPVWRPAGFLAGFAPRR